MEYFSRPPIIVNVAVNHLVVNNSFLIRRTLVGELNLGVILIFAYSSRMT
jgi:hypothetical protein